MTNFRLTSFANTFLKKMGKKEAKIKEQQGKKYHLEGTQK